MIGGDLSFLSILAVSTYARDLLFECFNLLPPEDLVGSEVRGHRFDLHLRGLLLLLDGTTQGSFSIIWAFS